MSVRLIRFSSLGDVVLTAGLTGPLGPVTYITSERYRPLVERFEGVVEVIGLAPGESVASLAARVPPCTRAVDLHGSLRSMALCARLGGATRRLDKARLARWRRVAWKSEAPLPTVVERYAAACGIEPAPRPWIRLERHPEALGLVPGAAHATKAWPAERFAEVGRRWPGPVLVLGGPGEEALVDGVVRAIGDRAEAVVERGFDRTLGALARCRAVVAGDTGLMHLAGACGVPVVGLFGPTTSGDGFWCHPGQPVELPIPCRPCARYGGPRCPIGDHRCMRDLDSARVIAAVEALAA